MKDIFTHVGRILSYVFAALVITYTSLLTWQLAQRLIPDNTVLQFMTLVLFDIAALVWFVTFLTQAKGTLQWAIAGIGFLVGLAGAIIMAGGELILGQRLVVLDDPTVLGWALVSTVVVAALCHASLIYGFHLCDPSTKNRIENAQQVSKAIEKAYADARSEIERHNQELTESLRASVMYEAQQQIAGATAAHIRGAALLEEKAGETLRGGLVIPGTVKESGSSQVLPRRRWYRPRGNGKKPGEPIERADLLAAITELLNQERKEPAAGYAADTIGIEQPRPNGSSGQNPQPSQR